MTGVPSRQRPGQHSATIFEEMQLLLPIPNLTPGVFVLYGRPLGVQIVLPFRFTILFLLEVDLEVDPLLTMSVRLACISASTIVTTGHI